MKTLITRSLFVLLALAALVVPASAQSYTISNTTLNGAITASATSLVLTSASASSGSSFGAPAVGQCLVVEGETMLISAVSSTTMTVRRGPQGGGGNPAVGHATLAIVWTAPCNAFKLIDPPVAKGNSSCSLQPAPWINLKNGNVWWCNTAVNTWSGSNYIPFSYNTVPIAQ